MTDSSSWIIVQGSDATVYTALVNAALQAAPPDIREGGHLLPRKREPLELCKLCGSADSLTRETRTPTLLGEQHACGDAYL